VSRYRHAALFLALSAVWGSAFAAIKAGLAFFPPVLFAAVRYDVAGLVMVGYAASATDRWRPSGRGEWTVVATSGALMIAAYHALLFVGQQHVTSAVAAVLVGLNPIATTGFARALLPDERLTPVGVLGLLLGLVGVAVLARPEPANRLDPAGLGVALVFGAVVAFSLGSVLVRRATAAPSIELQTAWSMLLGALLMHLVSAGLGERPAAIDWTPAAVASLAYLAVVASAAGFLVYFDLLERLGPVEINLVSYVAPIFAALTGLALLGERVTASTVAGFLIVVTGFVLVKRRAISDELGRLGDRSPGRAD
jgi:drug/metabolite transporter (DMT)-like permease